MMPVETTQKPPTNPAALYMEAEDLLDRLRRSREPLTLDAEERQDLATLLEQFVARLDRAEAAEGIRRGLEQAEHGQGRDARTVLGELRQKLRIPDDY